MTTPEKFLEQLEKNGYFIWDNFLIQETTTAIRAAWDEKIQNAQLTKAGIGKDGSYAINSAERGDFISWIAKENADDATKAYLEKISMLIHDLNRNFFMGIRGYECHFAFYPSGTKYARHADRHRSGSARVVSFVFYLNENWREEDGGLLRIYENNEVVEAILPTSGRLVVFLSEKEHEVMLTYRPRTSITGWMLNQ
jgi:SM-20-related protein